MRWRYVPMIIIAFAAPFSARAQEVGGFCMAGWQAMINNQLEKTSFPQPASPSLVYDVCKPGDTVLIPVSYFIVIARVCDVSQAIAVLPGTGTLGSAVLCRISNPKCIRNRRGSVPLANEVPC